jgi:hypothetical protein
MFGLYAVGMLIGFISIPLFVRFKRMDEKEAIDFDEAYNQILLGFKFMEQVEEAPDSSLNEEELKGLKDKMLHYEIPYLKHQVIMFYDAEREAFCYYSNSTIIYKYLNVVARKYVLDYACKQIYKEMLPCTKKEEKTVTFGQFVPKIGKTTLEKDMNRFLYLGNLHDYKPALPEPNKITFSDYRKQIHLEVELEETNLNAEDSDSSSIPDIQLTKTD